MLNISLTLDRHIDRLKMSLLLRALIIIRQMKKHEREKLLSYRNKKLKAIWD